MMRIVALSVVTVVLAAAPAFAQAPATQQKPQTPPPTASPAPQPPGAQQPAPPAQPPGAQQPAPAAQPPRPFPEGAKVAFINTQRIANESTEGKSATAKLKALNDKKAQELNDKQKQLQAMQQKLQSGGSVLSDQARGQLEKDIEKANVDIQRFTQDAQAELQDMTQQLQGDFERRLRPIIAQVSQEKGLLMVFGPDSGIVWADSGLDITADVIKRFDAAAPAATAPKQ